MTLINLPTTKLFIFINGSFINILLLAAPTVLQRYRIGCRLSVSNKKA